MSSSPSSWKTKSPSVSPKSTSAQNGPAHLARQSRSPQARGQTDTSAKRFHEMTLATEADLHTNLSKRQPAVTEQLVWHGRSSNPNLNTLVAVTSGLGR
jgi:hypothetical protein